MASALWRAGLSSRRFAIDSSCHLNRAIPIPFCRQNIFSLRSSSSTQTFHHLDVSTTPHVPFSPPVPRHNLGVNNHVPSVPHVTSAVVEGRDGAKKRERKQKYLDSLMEKAGELSLKCELRMVLV